MRTQAPRVTVGMTRTHVYRCWSGRHELLYVGTTSDLGRRMAEHARTKPWWPQVTRVTAEPYASRTMALWAEWVAICTERPVHNQLLKGSKTPPPPQGIAAQWVALGWAGWLVALAVAWLALT